MDIYEFLVKAMPVLVALAAIVLVLAAFCVHELGHAFKMRKWGVEMQEITLVGLGPIAWRGTWPSAFGQTPLHVRWIPFGAFVLTTDAGTAKMKQLPAHAQCDISGAGVTANLIYALILITLAYCYTWLFRATIPPENVWQVVAISIDSVLFAVFIGTISFCLWHYNHHVSSYLYPILGICVLWLVGSAIWNIQTAKQAAEIMAGPIGVTQLGGNILSAHPDPILGPLMVGFNLSLAIGLSNLLPLFPLDGGHIAMTTLGRLMPNIYRKFGHIAQISGALILFTLVVWALMSDIVRVINWII